MLRIFHNHLFIVMPQILLKEILLQVYLKCILSEFTLLSIFQLLLQRISNGNISDGLSRKGHKWAVAAGHCVTPAFVVSYCRGCNNEPADIETGVYAGLVLCDFTLEKDGFTWVEEIH